MKVGVPDCLLLHILVKQKFHILHYCLQGDICVAFIFIKTNVFLQHYTQIIPKNIRLVELLCFGLESLFHF